MKVEDRIRHHADELRHQYQVAPTREPASRRNTPRLLVVAATAVAVLALIAPLALLMRSEPAPSGPIISPTTVFTSENNRASIGDLPRFELDGSTPADITRVGDSWVAAAGNGVALSDDRGATWTPAPLPNGGVLVGVGGDDTLLLAIGAHENNGVRLYALDDEGRAWQRIELPVTEGTVAAVPLAIAALDGEYALAGLTTESTLASDATLTVWRSQQGAHWTRRVIAEVAGDFTYIEDIVAGPAGPIVVAHTDQNRLLAFHEIADEWVVEDLGAVALTQGGISPELTNMRLVHTESAANQLTMWWSFNNGNGNEFEDAGAVFRYTTEDGWGAEAMQGTIPESIVAVDGGFAGVAGDGVPNVAADGSSMLASLDGVTWQTIAHFDGIDLGSLVAVDDVSFLVAGNLTTVLETGGTKWGTGAGWTVRLASTVDRLLTGEPGG